MEMILAFAVTLLAIILGFLSTKGLYLVQGFLQLIDRVTSKSKKAVRMDDSRSVEKEDCGEKASNTKQDGNSGCKENQDNESNPKVDDSDAFFIDSGELHALSPTESDGTPVKVKEFIRMLRENQENDLTEEEKVEEKRIQKQQLEEILQLMQSSQNQYGISSIDEMEEQMKLYALGN